MKAGSQCQYQRPSRCRRTLARPSGLTRRGRCGRVGGDGVCRLFQRREPLETGAHEIGDPFDSLGVRLGGDVDEDEPGRHRTVARAFGQQRRHAAEGGAHQHGEGPEGVDHGHAIRPEGSE